MESNNEPIRVLLDTQLYIFGHSKVDKSAERLLSFLTDHRTEFVVLLSEDLLDQIRRVARRVRGKDWAGEILTMIWSSFLTEVVTLPREQLDEVPSQFPDIPTEDIGVFLTAKLGRADVMVSDNRKFVRSAAASQNLFTCLTVEEFLSQYTHQG